MVSECTFHYDTNRPTHGLVIGVFVVMVPYLRGGWTRMVEYKNGLPWFLRGLVLDPAAFRTLDVLCGFSTIRTLVGVVVDGDKLAIALQTHFITHPIELDNIARKVDWYNFMIIPVAAVYGITQSVDCELLAHLLAL